MKRALWIVCLIVLAGATYFLITGLQTEMEHLCPDADTEDLAEDEAVFTGIFSGVIDDSDFEPESKDTFFAEYRLQRDRVRAQEAELLEGLIENPQAGEEARKDAEEKLLEMVGLMEEELLIENILKAQGYEDALFFYRKGAATVMLKTESLSDMELARVAKTASDVIGVSPESVHILMQY